MMGKGDGGGSILQRIMMCGAALRVVGWDPFCLCLLPGRLQGGGGACCLWAPRFLCPPGDQISDCFGELGDPMGCHRWNDLPVASPVFWSFMTQYGQQLWGMSQHRKGQTQHVAGWGAHFLALGY